MNNHHLTRLGGAGAAVAFAIASLAGPAQAVHHPTAAVRLPRLTTHTPLYDVGVRRPTLDDVFLFLTGHVAEEESASNGEDEGSKRGRRKSREKEEAVR